MAKRIGKQTITITNPVRVQNFASVVGKKESEGPLGSKFDKIYVDENCSENSFEKAESILQKTAVEIALHKAGLTSSDIDGIFAGDLLNQCIGSSFGLRDFKIPFSGLYGACSTMALSISMAAIMIDSGAMNKAIAVTSSHFCSAERQFRFPLEYGGQRTPNSQWTVTGSGAVILTSNSKYSLKITNITIGKIIDLGIKDMNNMGAAMAPAAADTIKAYLQDTGTKAEDYDLILTGDLGRVGSNLLYELLEKEGVFIQKKHNDCGLIIFDLEKQDVHAGGSGCGCSGSVLCSEILPKIRTKELNNVIFCATGALMSPTSSLQGESIPSIAHIVNFQS